SNVANSKDTWATGFQRTSIVGGIEAGQHEAVGIQLHARAGEPFRVRFRPDEEEEVANGTLHLRSRPAAPPADPFEHTVAAFQTADLGLRHHLHIGKSGDAFD